MKPVEDSRVDWLTTLSEFWPHLAAGFDLLAVLLTSGHVLLHKRDTRAATIWIGVILLIPLFGPVLYLTLGFNRIRRRAVVLGVHGTLRRDAPENLGDSDPSAAAHLHMLASVAGRVVARPLTSGNRIEVLTNGDEAFPAMLSAIEAARQSISLTTYIFDNDESGKEFAAALGRAVTRGVKVRVLVDAAGARYSWPPVPRLLKHHGVAVARFLPSFMPWSVTTINLRSHRKVLVVDGTAGFTGGMNIRHGNRLRAKPKSPVQDLHFRVDGPVVTQLQEAFANDWAFTTREVLDGPEWFPELPERGEVVARVITDGPDADFEKLRWILLAALAEAQTSVQILTPYFLPDPVLVSALNLAALRGVKVDIILPEKNNLPFVHWASRAMWWQVLERGCRLWLTPPPFDHSKLTIVDGHWVLLGSSNWDARSLRLNFELNVECYGSEFARRMSSVVAGKLEQARPVTLAEADGRRLAPRLRDALARLFSPYL
ncbi:MAG: cardiolipin synthase [Verrucomicrobiota bacterium]